MFRKKRSSSNPVIHVCGGIFANIDGLNSQASSSNPQLLLPQLPRQAFVKKQLDDGKLSAGAAAAALRAHTPTPASPADLTTKRMIRRGSVSSVGSASSGARQAFGSQLQRRGSNGSMSSRTFRSPSPGGRNAAPPVPALPRDIPPIPSKSHRRTPSEELPRRMLSPPPQSNGRASSLDSSKWAAPIQQRTRLQTSRLERVPEQSAAVSPGGTTRNVNFSRPMSPPMSSTSPVNGTYPTGIGRPRPASSMGLTAEQYRRLQQRHDAHQAQQQTRQATTTKVVYNPASRTVEKTIVAVPFTPMDMSPLQTPISSVPSSPASTKKLTLDMQGTPLGPQRQQSLRTVSAAGQRSVSMNSIPAPSLEEINSFQTRAASLLARPLTDSASFSAQPMPKPRSALLSDLNPPKRSATSNKGQPASGHTRTVSTPVSRSSAAAKPLARGESVSPARSARFSDAPLLDVGRHQPPPRSVSPVKSAMKGSHSPRTASPATSRTRDHSNHSDGSRSEESGAASARKKKGVRVSFEARQVIVGVSAGESMDPVDTVMSPQYIKSLEGRKVGNDSDDFDMGPRPALPLFGSVRDQQRPTDNGLGRSTAPGDEPDELGQSKFVANSATSREIKAPDSHFTVQHDAGGAINEETQQGLVGPQIEVQPATPALGEGQELEQDPMDETTDKAVQGATIVGPSQGSDATAGESQKALANQVPHWASTHLKDENYSDTDDGVDEDFSDAAEDQDGVETSGGFASLDAILESPAVESAPPVYPTTESVARSPQTEATIPERDSIPVVDTPAPAVDPALPNDEDWDTVRAYWSALSDQKKKELELQANPRVVPEEDVAEPVPKASSKRAAQPDNGERLPPWPDQQYQQMATSKPKPKSTLKQSSQPQPVNPVKTAAGLAAKPRQQQQKSSEDPTHMRKSMRSGQTMRTSMTQRPVSTSVAQQPRTPQQPSSKRPASTIAVPNASPAAIAMAQSMKPRPVPVRTFSNDSSTSESSFRKKRRGSDSTAGGGYSFARSMRGGARAAPMDDRPMSPPRPVKTGKPKKTSIRESAPAESKGGFMGFGKGKSKPSKAKGKLKGGSSGGGGSRFKSRFADSSDEDSDGGGGGGFSSRFKSRFDQSDDSSDDDVAPAPRAAPSKLTPVRPIPQKAGKQDGDSTELEDSEEDTKGPRSAVPGPASAKKRPGTPPASTALNFGNKASPTSPAGPTTPQRAEGSNGTTTQGNALGAGMLRKDDDSPTQKRRSFFHRRDTSKDKANDLSTSKWAPQAGTAPTSPTSPNAPVPAQTGTAPPSRPVTPTNLPKSLRANPPKAPTQRSSSRHSFFRRSSSSAPHSPAANSNPGMTKDSYPFPPPPIPSKYAGFAKSPQGAGAAIAEEGRPNTSDGVSNKGSSTLVERPGLGNKRESAMTAPSISGRSTRAPVYSEKTGRKKRFGGLRRVFGLND